MTVEDRIAQFERLVAENPNDALAQFSLGNAYFDSGRFQDAGPCFQRVLAINPQHSMAYLMLGKVQKQTGHPEFSIETLSNGYRVAHRRGEMKPRDEMAALLKELGAAPPAIEDKPRATTTSGEPGSEGFACSRCGSGGPRLKERPFKGPLGEKVLANVCEPCWKEWIAQGTRVINELRLPMFDPQAQELYDQHMKDFLGLSG
jgi:Fe-S cluster biosynthesis and repair protein YggX